jgi:two-component system chemotaxis response regulator CheY
MRQILLVEDNETYRDLVKRLLEQSFAGSVHVLTASNGREALEIIESLVVDFVITDYGMPEMDGGQLVEALAAKNIRPSIPVLVITGGIEPEAGERLKKFGVLGILEKPVQGTLLKQWVRRTLELESGS